MTTNNLKPVDEYYNDALKQMARAYNLKLTNSNNKLLKKEELYNRIKEYLNNKKV